MKKFFREFKAFISKGNVFDMAVGLIIATAFNKIVSSLVNDIIMPLVTWGTGKNSLADLSVVLKQTTDVNGDIVQLTWKYGTFLQTVLDFLIIAFSVFVMVKIVTHSRNKFKEISEDIVESVKKATSKERRELKRKAKAEGLNYKDLLKELETEKLKKQELEKQKLLEEEKNKPKPITEMDVLVQIRDLLKEKEATEKIKDVIDNKVKKDV